MQEDNTKPQKYQKVERERFIAEGIVEDAQRQVFFIKIEGIQKSIKCHLSGGMRKNHIRVLNGDHVKIEICKEDPDKGIIIHRFK